LIEACSARAGETVAGRRYVVVNRHLGTELDGLR
jgi:hypothetical protein